MSGLLRSETLRVVRRWNIVVNKPCTFRLAYSAEGFVTQTHFKSRKHNVMLITLCLHLLCVRGLQEEMFVPFPLRLQSNQAGYACITKALPIPSSRSEIQQISDQYLLHSVLMLVRSWIEPLVYLQTTLERYDNAPDLLLNKTKWLSEKLLSLEQGVLVLITKMLNEGMVSTSYSDPSLVQYDMQLDMLESIMRDYTLFNCFKKDAHKMEAFLKLLKCRQTNNCA
uniref:Somatolactin alpha n=1 Tax=Neogobius melanostomus TaxID=47308 RepID=A0A8C6SYS7_9GOBI